MNALPQSTQLGKLEIVEIYEYYDRPLLFACRNELNHLFLALYDGESDENNEIEYWLYVPISQRRFESIRSGVTDLHDAFTQAEQGFVYRFTLGLTGEILSETHLLIGELDDERLPDAGERLDLTNETLPKLANVLVQSQQMNRDIVHLRLEFDNKASQEAPARPLGKILAALQELIDKLAPTTDALYRESNRLPRGLLGAVELSVLNVGAGSFEVELASSIAKHIDMFDSEILSNTLESLAKLIQTEATQENITRTLGEFQSQKVASKYLTFLNSIKSSIDTTELEWASSATGRSGKVNITSPRVFQTIDILKQLTETRETRLEFIGTLLGFDIKTRNFRIDWPSRETTVSGKVSNDVTVEDFDFMKTLTLSERYKAVVIEKTTYKAATDEEKRSYTLIQLADTENPEPD